MLNTSYQFLQKTKVIFFAILIIHFYKFHGNTFEGDQIIIMVIVRQSGEKKEQKMYVRVSVCVFLSHLTCRLSF